jgi:peptidoglycan/LPS O-acetylase OafA/YrhL
MTAGDQPRIAQFDGLRAFAFLAVFVHHAFGAPLLWMGVDLFFVLSGFLITRNLLRLRRAATRGSALGAFYFRRLLRIIPPYYIALALIFTLTSGGRDHAAWYFGFASNIHDAAYGPDNGALSTMWSIAIEEQFYVVWPWFVLLLPRRRLATMFWFVIGLAAVFRYAFSACDFNVVYRLTICRMDLLASGALLALIESRSPNWFSENRSRFVAVMGATAIAFALASFALPHFTRHGPGFGFAVFGYGASTVFFSALLAYSRNLRDGIALRILIHPVIQYVGKISYMCYLTHRLAIELARGIPRLGTVGIALVALAATIAVSTLSWYCVEQPLLRKRDLVRIRALPS